MVDDGADAVATSPTYGQARIKGPSGSPAYPELAMSKRIDTELLDNPISTLLLTPGESICYLWTDFCNRQRER